MCCSLSGWNKVITIICVCWQTGSFRKPSRCPLFLVHEGTAWFCVTLSERLPVSVPVQRLYHGQVSLHWVGHFLTQTRLFGFVFHETPCAHLLLTDKSGRPPDEEVKVVCYHGFLSLVTSYLLTLLVCFWLINFRGLQVRTSRWFIVKVCDLFVTSYLSLMLIISV